MATVVKQHGLAPPSSAMEMCTEDLSPADTNVPAVLNTRDSFVTILSLAGLNFVTSYNTGVMTIAIPSIIQDIGMDEGLAAWPVAVFSLVCGTLLIFGGSLADILGPRPCNLTGGLLITGASVACSVAQSGGQLIAFRAFLGLANALTIPSSISIASTYLQSGRPRNFGIASLGWSQPLGISLGLVLGGLFTRTSDGWRKALYMDSGLAFVFLVAGFFVLPKNRVANPSSMSKWSQLLRKVDWVGLGTSSGSLAMFCYVLATIAADLHSINSAQVIVLLVLSVVFFVSFFFWQDYRVKVKRPALIPNAIWKNTAFSSVCFIIAVALVTVQALEFYCSLFFQNIQGLSALEASVRILPNLIVGVLTSIFVGLFIHKLSVIYVVTISTALTSVACLLMALIKPDWTYWSAAFVAQMLAPLSCDATFPIGVLIVSDVFPKTEQALAGAILNTMAQVGASISFTFASVLSTAVSTQSTSGGEHIASNKILEGYRASFWFIFSLSALSCLVGAFGMRQTVNVGKKRD